jgi:hypothetical protein
MGFWQPVTYLEYDVAQAFYIRQMEDHDAGHPPNVDVVRLSSDYNTAIHCNLAASHPLFVRGLYMHSAHM